MGRTSVCDALRSTWHQPSRFRDKVGVLCMARCARGQNLEGFFVGLLQGGTLSFAQETPDFSP